MDPHQSWIPRCKLFLLRKTLTLAPYCDFGTIWIEIFFLRNFIFMVFSFTRSKPEIRWIHIHGSWIHQTFVEFGGVQVQRVQDPWIWKVEIWIQKIWMLRLGFLSAPVLRTEADLQVGHLYVCMYLTSLLLDEHNFAICFSLLVRPLIGRTK